MGTGGPDNVGLQTILHRSWDLAEQGPITVDESSFAESLLEVADAKRFRSQLEKGGETFVIVSGNFEWGPWGLQSEVAWSDWAVHSWTPEDFETWFREGRLLKSSELWTQLR